MPELEIKDDNKPPTLYSKNNKSRVEKIIVIEGRNESDPNKKRDDLKESLLYIIMMLLLGIIFISIAGYFALGSNDLGVEYKIWFLRILMAFGVAALSMSLAGTISVKTHYFKETGNEIEVFTENEKFPSKYPAISATGALAIFVLIYMVDPISTYTQNNLPITEENKTEENTQEKPADSTATAYIYNN